MSQNDCLIAARRTKEMAAPPEELLERARARDAYGAEAMKEHRPYDAERHFATAARYRAEAFEILQAGHA